MANSAFTAAELIDELDEDAGATLIDLSVQPFSFFRPKILLCLIISTVLVDSLIAQDNPLKGKSLFYFGQRHFSPRFPALTNVL